MACEFAHNKAGGDAAQCTMTKKIQSPDTAPAYTLPGKLNLGPFEAFSLAPI